MIDFLTRNFPLASAVSVIASAALVMTAVFGYLSVFDCSLIWIIEYTDLLKLFLVGAAILTGATSLTIEAFQSFFAMERIDRVAVVSIIIAVFGASLILGTSIYFDLQHPETAEKTYHVLLWLSSLSFLFVTYRLGSWVRGANAITFQAVAVDLSYLVAFVFIFGFTYGMKVLEQPGGLHNVTIKDGSGSAVIRDVKIIMITGHHTVFLNGGEVITIPTDSIMRISYFGLSETKPSAK